MAANKRKKLVSVSEDLLKEASELSRRRGSSVGRIFEDALQQSIRVNGVGYDLKQVADFFEIVQAHKVLGGIFVPSNVLDYLVDSLYKTDKETLQAKWHESGNWTGKYLKEKFDNPVETLRTFLEFSRWDLNEVDVKEVNSSVKIRCISTVLTRGSTELLCKFIEGILTGMGYQIDRLECLKGMIIIESKL